MASTRFTTQLTFSVLLLYLNPLANGQFTTRTEIVSQTQTEFGPTTSVVTVSSSTATALGGGSSGNPPPQPSLGPFPDIVLDDTNPAFQYFPTSSWVAADLSTVCDVYSCIGNPSTTLTFNKTWHEIANTGVHGDPPPKVTLTFQGQNYGAASFLTPINQPFPQDITFLYTFTLDGALVSTYNSTLPRVGDVSSQPPNYTWNPTIVFISIPNPGLHTLEIDVLQGPILFDQFQYFMTNSTGGGVGGGGSVVGGESESEPEPGEQSPGVPSVNSLSPSISAPGASPTNKSSGPSTNGSNMLEFASSGIYSAVAIFGGLLLNLYLL